MGAKFFYRNIDLVYFVNNKLINNNLINQKDRVLLSFSGGQDSICFVFILNQLCSQLELDITFFWYHHLWQTDSFYVMQQIAKLSFLLQFNSCFPIPLNSISSELLARKWRQRCSYRVSLFYNYSKICLAHTFNDKVENIFLNFIRGTGLIGLTPLRWTQFISKSNIINEKNISRHTYLNNSCGTNLTNRRFVPVARFSNSIRSSEGAVIGTVIGAIIKKSCQLLQIEDLGANQSTPFIPFAKQSFVSPLPSAKQSFAKGIRVMAKEYEDFGEILKFCASMRNDAVIQKSPLSFTGYGTSLKPNEPNLYIPQGNYDKLKNLTKKVIKKFIQRDLALLQPQRDVLYKLTSYDKSYKSKICRTKLICTICNSWQSKKGLEQFLFQRGTQRITNLTSINTRFIRRFVQIGKPLPQNGMFCFATKARPLPITLIPCKGKGYTKLCFAKGVLLSPLQSKALHWVKRSWVSTGVTNEYKAKSCRASTFQPTSDSSMNNSCRTNNFTEQRRPMLLQIIDLVTPSGYTKQSNWYKLTSYNKSSICKICTTSPKHGKKLLNCGKGCYIVRPLLSISRIELNKICYFWKLPIYPDKSNQKVKFFRNRVRGQLLPTIKLFFNLNIENIFLQLAKIIETEDYCLNQVVNEFIKNTDVYHTKLHIYSKK